MALAAVGTNTVTSLSRRYIVPRIFDNVYGSSPLFFRWNRMNKILIRGGYQIEFPLMYTRMAAGGWYQGYQLLNVNPSDTIQNGVVAWKQAYTPITVDGLTLLRADSPLAVADYVATQFKQAEMDMVDQLGAGTYSDGTNPLIIDGVFEVVSNSGAYAGIAAAGNVWWQAQIDAVTATMSLLALNNLFNSTLSGGRAPTIILSDVLNYGRFWNLTAGNTAGNPSLQRFIVQPGGKDMQLAQAGYENQLFNGVPWVMDGHISSTPPNNGPIFLNEAYWDLIVSERANFKLQDFQTPVNQDAMTALLLWAGNLICGNRSRNGRFTNLSG